LHQLLLINYWFRTLIQKDSFRRRGLEMSDDLDGFGSDEETCFQCDLPPEACNSCPYNLGADLGNFYEGENDEKKD
jgi:hypothetical protein